jgi:hypothetical protein
MLRFRNKTQVNPNKDAEKHQQDIKFYDDLFCQLEGKTENDHAFSLGQEGQNKELDLIGGGEANALCAVARLLCRRFPVL